MGRVKLRPRIVDGRGGAGGGTPVCQLPGGGKARVLVVCGDKSGEVMEG